MNNINWLECKEVCRDCPTIVKDSNKVECQHPWREYVRNCVEKSDDASVPFDTPEVCVHLGATVSRHLINGQRPSVQLFEEEPQARKGYLKSRIASI